MKQIGMIKEITSLYVIIDEKGKDLKVRYVWDDNITRFKAGNFVQFETEERESKEDLEVKYLRFTSLDHAEAPKPDEAFQTGKVVRDSKLAGVQVEEEPGKKTLSTLIETDRQIIYARGLALKAATETISSGATPDEVMGFAERFEKWLLRKE